MSGDDRPFVICEQHGESYATYVCEHLAANPVQEWFCDYPSQENPWPDAWCGKRDESYLREGEWNERNEAEMKVTMICDRCYEDARAASADCLTGERLREWERFVGDRCAELGPKQDKLVREFELDKHERWDYDQESGSLVFSNQGVPAVRAAIQFIGSFSNVTNTWLWAWANFSVNEDLRQAVIKVRDLGDERHFPRLAVPKWKATEEDGWHMAAIAAEAMGALGVYRAPKENGFTYLAIMSADHAS